MQEKESSQNYHTQIQDDRNMNKIGKNITDDDMEKLCVEKIHTIQNLYLSGNYITPQGVKFMYNANWTSLCFLTLSSNYIHDFGCKYLTRVPMPQLKDLCLSVNQIGSVGIIHLSKGCWDQLRAINLSKNNIGSEGVHYLMMANWKVMYKYSLNKNQIPYQQALRSVLDPKDHNHCYDIRDNSMNNHRRLILQRFHEKKCTKERVNKFQNIANPPQ